MKNFSTLLLLFFFFTIPVYSQITIHIPGDYPTIQEGIDAANNGDLVLVADGIYLENISFMGKAITVASHFIQDGDKTHIENTIIDGSQPSHPDTASVVSFMNGEDTTSVLCGFTITGGNGTFYSPADTKIGGGIMLLFSGAKICHNNITFNTIDNSTIYTLCRGGGIFAASSPNLIIANNVISENQIENSASVGGGIAIYQTGLSWIISNKILNNVLNTNTGSGGGIDIWGPVTDLYIQNNIIKGNQALTNNYGGGGIDIWDTSSPVFISNNLITENVGYLGGGILVDNPTDEDYKKLNSYKLNNHLLGESDRPDISTFPTNKSLLEDVIENNTIVNNYATYYCGGIYCRNTSPEIRNSIIWGNTAPAGSQIEGAGLVEYSDVEGGYAGEGNIDEDPAFNDLTYFCLCDTSGCIDMGNPDPGYNDVEDPNNPGFALYPAMGTLRNDMGAFGGPNSTWSSVLSDTLYVPGDYSTIQAAIDAANNGDYVLVADGLYYENINFKGKAITVTSHFLVDGDSTHIENTIINGSQAVNSDSGSVVYLISGEDTTSVLCGFTITGGTGTIWNFQNIYRKIGGGICLINSSAKIKNNIIEYNAIEATTDLLVGGGGIGIRDEGDRNFIITNNVIRNNTLTSTFETYVSLGGAILIRTYGDVWILNNKIMDNTITSIYGWGGGISPYDYASGLADFYIISNVFARNKVIITGIGGEGGAGAIDIYETYPIFKNNLILGNSAPSGGGIHIEFTGEESKSIDRRCYAIQEQMYKNNYKSSYLDVPILENNTVANNTATIYGGGIKILGTTPQLMNFIVWGNDQVGGPQIYGTADVQYSDVEGGYAGTGNIIMDPHFITDNPYYLLSSSSQCIDRGNPDPMYNDAQDPQNPGNPMWPSQGTLRNDMGHCGGPASLWCFWDWPMPVESSSHSVSEFALMHNYPNPFNPSTTIKYEIKELTNVELKVFDILGREVISLVNEEQTTGRYEIEFDASALSSGVYFYKLEAGDFIQTKKMMLLK